jgi:hypothetical protein
VKIIFIVPWDCIAPEIYDTSTTPVPSVGTVIKVQADLEKRNFMSSPKTSRQVRCIVNEIEHNLTKQTIKVFLVNE